MTSAIFPWCLPILDRFLVMFHVYHGYVHLGQRSDGRELKFHWLRVVRNVGHNGVAIGTFLDLKKGSWAADLKGGIGTVLVAKKC